MDEIQQPAEKKGERAIHQKISAYKYISWIFNVLALILFGYAILTAIIIAEIHKTKTDFWGGPNRYVVPSFGLLVVVCWIYSLVYYFRAKRLENKHIRKINYI